MYFLCLDTATEACSVVLYHYEEVVAFEYTDKPKVHSQYLTTFIQNVLAKAGISITQIVGVVLSEGPGSYTGLRIGMSTAKGIAYALDIPLLLIPSTMVAAYSGVPYIEDTQAILIGLVDAPNAEIYAQSFVFQQKEIIPSTSPQHYFVDANFLTPWVSDTPQKIYLSGRGASKIKNLYLDNDTVIVIEQARQDMHNIGKWIIHTYTHKTFSDIELCEPLYVKDFTPTLKAKKVK